MEAIGRKENHLTYFKFFFNILRFRLFLAISMNIFIGFLDGIGLTILFPLLQSVEGTSGAKESMGQLKYIVSAFEGLGIPLTANVILVVFLLLFLLKAIVRYLANLYQTKIQLHFIRKIQFEFLTNLRRMSYRGYLKLDAGNIQNTLIAEVLRVSEAMKAYLKWSNALFLLLTYILLAYLANPGFALLITVGVSLINLVYRSIYKKIKAASYETSKRGTNLNAYLIELVHYFKYLKSTNYLNRYSVRLKTVINESFNLEYKIGKLSSIIVSIKEPTAVFVVVMVMMIQINFFQGGISSIVLSLLLFYRGMNHLMNLQSEWQGFIRLNGAFRMVSEVSKRMKSYQEEMGNVVFSSIKKDIRLKDVNLSFGKNKVLHNISLEIPKNTTVALTGVSGSGKTTIVNIVSGLVKPDEGKVTIDDLELSEYDLESYRSKIGYISQESVVFNDSVFNNITFWAEPTDENKERFWEVVEMASLTEFIENLDAKENARLGDNGILISGGQRQRISIARELYKKPELLILDEATSALDSETEKVIQENIEKLHGTYTMIIIAHRLSTVKNADRIYLLEKGRISHSGRFDELVEESEKFRNMVSLQKVMQ
jgi:ABC-type bacteriocin/lantibiotic exporter with double-glycine peptidase domain